MNVFVRCYPDSSMRFHLAAAVIERLASEHEVHVILPNGSRYSFEDFAVTQHFVSISDFHLASKRLAAEAWWLDTSGDYLIILDDDQLPLYKDWIGYAEYLTKRYPEYAAIAGWSVTHEVPRPAALIEESDSIGCPMIVRRSALLDATAEPINNTARADTILTGRLQRHGKTGIARNWRYNHLGMGYSQCIPQHWMPECPV